jgi:hypothetical protein
MTTKITDLVNKIAALEQQLVEELRQQQEEFHYQLEDSKVKFERTVLTAHRKLRASLLPWLRSSSLGNVISAPFIYMMIVPLAFLDLMVTLYQQLCFRLYQLPRVKRGDYIVLDRHQLAYLNGIEKFNCVYCGYGNGVVAYTREIVSRTEQYWCPIKHARKVVGVHKRYHKFLDYGDAENYSSEIVRLREDLKKEE